MVDPPQSEGMEVFLWLPAIRRLFTNASGGVDGNICKTRPNTEAVSLYLLTEYHNADLLCSVVLLSISLILSGVTRSVSLNAATLLLISSIDGM